MEKIQIESVTLYHADCLDVLPLLSVDHIISDPPYEDELHAVMEAMRRNDGGPEGGALDFEGINKIRKSAARVCVSSCSKWLLLFCMAEGVRAWRDDIQDAGGKWDTPLVWLKADSVPRMNGTGPTRGFDCIATAWCGKERRKWNGGGKRGVFNYNSHLEEKKIHPTEKPLPLMLELVKLYTNPGDVVCDPFMGSGTTGVACVSLERKFIGIEKKKEYFDRACTRLTNLQKARGNIPVSGENESGFLF
jgi:site-specific DNA-methyltransferase (adenine-specific)